MSTTPRSHAILLVSGAGLPEWIWDGVRDRLGAVHETRVAPRSDGETAGIRVYAEAALGSVSAERVTIVAHSAGGVVAAEAAQLAPERVGGLLAVSAIVPVSGGSFLTAMPAPSRWVLGAAMRLAGTRPPDSAIRGALANGLDEQLVARIVADFRPEPQRFYRDRVGSLPWDGSRGYVTTARDRELPPALQERFAARLGGAWRRELATGHLPMLEDSARLAEAITAFVGEGEARLDTLGG